MEIEGQKDITDVVECNGNLQLTFDLADLSAAEQEQLFDVVTKFAVEYPHSENADPDDELITADQIDDQGNLMADKMDLEDDDDDDYMDEEEEKN